VAEIQLPDPLAARVKQAAAERGTTVERFVEDAVETHLRHGRSWQPGDPERRRDRRTILDATGTGAEEHQPDDQ
jgi:hypothetical protein